MKEDNILRIMGKNIKNARTTQKITQSKLAEKLNTSDKFISMLERGESRIKHF